MRQLCKRWYNEIVLAGMQVGCFDTVIDGTQGTLTGEYKETNGKRIAHGKAIFKKKYGGGEYIANFKDGKFNEGLCIKKDRNGNIFENERKENDEHGFSLYI
jgi:hypothetical protein